MQRAISLLYFILISIFSFSQSTFEYQDDIGSIYNITSPRESMNSDIYFAYQLNFGTNRYGGVRRISKTGITIKEVEIKVEGKFTDVLKLELFEVEERILVFTSQFDNSKLNNFLNIKSLDLELNTISDTTIQLDSIDFANINQVSTTINEEGNIVAACVHGFEFTKYSNYFLEVTPYGEVLKFNSFNESNSPGQIFTISETNEGYLCIGNSSITINDSLNSIEYIETDKSYNIGNGIDMKKWNSNEYLVANYEGGTDYDYSLSILDSTYQVKNTAIYKDALNFVPNTLSVFGCLDFENQNVIYTGGHELSARRYYWIVQHDSTLTRNWIKFYDIEEESRYVTFGIEASKDGGVMVCGRHRNAPSTPYRGFLIKLNSNGDLLTSTTDQKLLRSSITVYPNPSDGLFRIKIDARSNREYKLTLTDSNGRQVHTSDRLSVGDHSFDFSHLIAGTYYFTLISDGNIKGQGSWVKM